jgi:hypothetical protein
MGFVNLPFPLLDLLDGMMQRVVAPSLRLMVWAAFGGVLSMGLYGLLSAQEKIARISGEAARARRALAAYDQEFKGLWRLARRSVALSLRHFGLAGLPALVACIPLVSLMAWLSITYGHRFPAPGAFVAIDASPPDGGLQCVPEPCPVSSDGFWQVAWPGGGRKVRLLDAAAREIADLPPAAPITLLHKRRWWNVVLGNPAGYVPHDALVDQIRIALPENEYLGFGPSWMRSWQVVFLSALTATSLSIKFWFGLR